MGVIAYDKPVSDFIAGLNATKHVTNVAYRKASVTFHHNGGRLTLQGILDVWKVRPASAHFQVDAQARLGQYVKVNEYAWASGNTQGNKESIHIELANVTLDPTWTVAEITWREGARLCGWLHARVLGVRPSRATVKIHSDWKATLCAGPHIRSILDTLIREAQEAYDSFVGSAPSPAPPPAPAGPSVAWGSGKPVDTVAREVIAGEWGNGIDRENRLRTAGYVPAVVQRTVNAILAGRPVPAAPPPAQPARKSIDQIAGEVIAGHWGNNPQRGQRLKDAGYSPTEVQNAVNRRVGGGGRSAPTRLSNATLARQVIAGQWGKGGERRSRLTTAGYDYKSVQAEVNRLLR